MASLAKLKLLWNAWKVLDQVEGELKGMDAKSILKSKTFWLNLVGVGLQFVDVVPQPYGMYALAVLNILNRLLTNQPVKISIS